MKITLIRATQVRFPDAPSVPNLIVVSTVPSALRQTLTCRKVFDNLEIRETGSVTMAGFCLAL